MPDVSPVTLKEITAETLPEILALEVKPEQLTHYPRSNAYSLAQAHFPPDAVDPDYDGLAARLVETPELIETLNFQPDAWFRGIYAGETPVGFVMLSLEPEKAEYFVWRIMIDHRCQGRGYGRLAMQAVIDFVRTLPNARQLYLSHLKGNDAMARFSQQLGFRYTGEEIVPGDLLMVLEIA